MVKERLSAWPLLWCSAFAWPALVHAEEPASALRGRLEATGPTTCENPSNACAILLGVTIDGATAFSSTELATHYEPYLTRAVSIDDVARIAQAIADRYHAAGYFLSRAIAPPQDMSAGIARIVVVEGRVSQVTIEAEGASAIASLFRGVEDEAPLKLSDLDRRLALANDTPGLSVKARIEPDPNDLRLHTLVLTADRQRFTGYVSVDNRGARSAGPLQAYARVAANSVLSPGDQAGLALLATPAAIDELAFVELSYQSPLDNGARLSAAVSGFRAQDGANAASPEIGGEGVSAVVGYQYPLLRRRGAGLWAGAALDAHEVRNDWTNDGGYFDALRVAQAMLRGFLSDGRHATTFFAQGSFGLDMMGASSATGDRRSRANADGQFSKLNVHVDRYDDLGPFVGFYVALDAQLADGPLLYSEEMAVGGQPYGRAYNYGEISGDNGIAGTVELRAGADPGLAPLTFLQGYIFIDTATVRNIVENGPDQDLSLSSAGAGVRATLAGRVTARAELARPLSRTPAEQNDKDWRPFISLSAAY